METNLFLTLHPNIASIIYILCREWTDHYDITDAIIYQPMRTLTIKEPITR